MIIPSCKYGKNTIPLLFEFGHGDIGVSPGLAEDHVVVAFNHIQPREIGSCLEEDKGKTLTTDDIQPIGLFLFDKVASIDVVIEALQVAKVHLENLYRS